MHRICLPIRAHAQRSRGSQHPRPVKAYRRLSELEPVARTPSDSGRGVGEAGGSGGAGSTRVVVGGEGVWA